MKNTSFTLLFLLVFSLLNAQNNCLDFDRTDDYVNCRSQPTLSNAVSCNNLVIGSSSALTVSSNTLTTTGNILNEGTLTVSGTLINNGISSTFINNGTLTDDGTVILRNLTNNSGKTVDINENKEMTINGDLNNSGTMTVKSSITGTGSLITNGTVSGSVTFQRYIVAWFDTSHGWHFLSSPVTTFTIDGSNFNPGTNDDLYRWEESTGLWMNHKAGDPTQIIPGTGYLTAWEVTDTKNFSGTLNNADISKSNLSYTLASTNTGWHLLGNPFPCALKWDATSWNRSNVNATAKIWNEIGASYIDIAQNGIIPATQAFMVYVSSSTNSLTIPKADRTHSPTGWYKNDEINKIKLTAYDTEGSTAQESIIKFNENATTGFDNEFDSWFLEGYAPQFYSLIPQGTLSTNALPEIMAATTIPMSFIKNASSTYYIEAEGVNNLIPQEMVYLTDLKTNHTQILNDNPVYDFTSEEGDIAERFVIHFSPLNINELVLSEQIKIFSANNNVEIRSNIPLDAKINIYNISGQLIGITLLNNESSASVNIPHYKGTVIVSIVTSGQTLTEKVIIW